MKQLNDDALQTHIRTLGWLNIAAGILTMLVAGFIFMLLSVLGLFSGDPEALPVLIVMGTFIGGFMFILALPSILAGFGLLRDKNWGRILAIIVSFFHLFSFPVGTALGIYGMWVLLRTETSDYFVVPKMA